jgi:uncharacterized OB-fold protein
MSDKPSPPIDTWTKPFWTGARQNKLLLQYCPACLHFIFYPRRYCPFCDSDQLEWVQAAGRGQVYAFTVVRNNAPSAFLADMPFVIAIVRLEEGVKMMTNIVGCEPDDVYTEMPVEVVFEPLNAEISLPKFKPASADPLRTAD